MDSEGPLFFDHSTDPNVPHARTTATINVRLALIFFIETSIVKDNDASCDSPPVDLYQSSY
jgi:hypothetical protein